MVIKNSPDPRCEPAPSILFSFWAASCTLPGCWSLLGVVVEAVGVAVPPVVPAAGEVAVVEVIGMVIWGLGGTAGLLMCLAAKSRSGMAFISSACVSSSRRLMSWALNWVKLARFSSQSRSAAWHIYRYRQMRSCSMQTANRLSWKNIIKTHSCSVFPNKTSPAGVCTESQ